ncbi:MULTISPECIES: putative cytokinetic ring protein SteA [Bacillaceae]|uniref:Thiamin pyrophosphokinase catalytic domain-containing protein n=1 Tax=Evansella alkalicola TaxID=745819 RepID=A0ABS6K0Z0_9BACI|nr:MULTISPECIES: putative cytokinetic ring protein SteA [Bacillaceae]MBU9724102.1 hypothetical protein [Bacillus alkalicola]
MEKKRLAGKAYFGEITKNLIHNIPSGAIVILKHEDIDIVAAEDLVRKKVKAVINTKTSVTGNLPRTGVLYLLQHGIPVFDLINNEKTFLKQEIEIFVGSKVLLEKETGKGWKLIGEVKEYTERDLQEKIKQGQEKFSNLYSQFAINSFNYAKEEMNIFLQAIENLPSYWELTGKQVFVIARGEGVARDIRLIRPILTNPQAKVIAVDGAASLLFQSNVKPDYIIGDMDSIPDNIVKYRSRFISHSYMDGRSPGRDRLRALSVDSESIPFPGLSEDLAIMLAFRSKAEHIYTMGCRASVTELVEKGRKGMGSTLLTRMYVGDRLSDLKGINRLMTIGETPLFYGEKSYLGEYKIDES